MILSWVLFPLVLAAIGLGWGALVQWIAGERQLGALTIPIGLASASVVAGILTAFSGTASLAEPVAAIGALAGVGYVWGRARLGAAPRAAAQCLGPDDIRVPGVLRKDLSISPSARALRPFDPDLLHRYLPEGAHLESAR